MKFSQQVLLWSLYIIQNLLKTHSVVLREKHGQTTSFVCIQVTHFIERMYNSLLNKLIFHYLPTLSDSVWRDAYVQKFFCH
jgi:hypothetical protein